MASSSSVLRPGVDLSVLTVDQLKALDQMRQIFKDEQYPDQEDPASWFQLEDWTYLRYLRARKFDVGKAELMLKNTLEMRRKYRPHALSPDEPALRAIIDLKMWYLLPSSKAHNPVQLTDVGMFDATKIESEEDFQRYLILIAELACRELVKDGWKAQLLMAVFDFQGFSLLRHTNARAMRMITMLIQTNDLNYPELLQKCILFNAPFLFKAPYKIIRPLLATDTQAKIHFVNDVKALDELMAPESRMERHGGTRKEAYPSIFYEKA